MEWRPQTDFEGCRGDYAWECVGYPYAVPVTSSQVFVKCWLLIIILKGPSDEGIQADEKTRDDIM